MAELLTGLRKLLENISHYNELAKTSSDGKNNEYHEKCKENVIKLANSKFGNISKTVKELSKAKATIGCEACNETFDYVNAYLNDDSETIKRIEQKYSIKTRGSAMLVDNIIYIDPDVKCPW